jgi:hypothetical protein
MTKTATEREAMKQTQGRAIIAELKRRPLTYWQMIKLGHGLSPQKRVMECLREDEQLVKGRHQPSDLVTWRVVPAPRNRQQERI